MESHVQCSYSDPKLQEYVNKSFVEKNLTYMIMDPFNKTYTPAKNVKGNTYQRAFQRAADQIKKQGVLEY